MALRRLLNIHVRHFHKSIRSFSEESFDIGKIIKSNSSHSGFDDLEKKKTTKKTTKSTTKKKSVQSDESQPNNDSLDSGIEKKKVTKKSVSKKKSKSDEIQAKNEEVQALSEHDIESTSSPVDSEAQTKVETFNIVDNTEPQTDINGKKYKVRIPDWMDIVLECPVNPTDSIDQDKFLHFKEFVEELEIKNLPTVTTIIKKTEPYTQFLVLKKWQERKTKELGGEEQFQEYRKKLLTRGSTLHNCIEKHFAGETEFEIESHIEGPWESIQHVLPDITDVRNTEKVIVHNELFYKGQIDCIGSYLNEPSLIEWKVSSKPKIMLSQTYDNPLQVAAYIGALNRCGILKRMKVPSITTGVLVITYEDGEPANVHLMNERICNKYWTRWTQRLYHYWALQYQQVMTSS